MRAAAAATAAPPGPRFFDWDDFETMAVSLSFLLFFFFERERVKGEEKKKKEEEERRSNVPSVPLSRRSRRSLSLLARSLSLVASGRVVTLTSSLASAVKAIVCLPREAKKKKSSSSSSSARGKKV